MNHAVTSEEKKRRYLILDGLRGVAAFGVLIFHGRSWMPDRLFSHGYLAVDFFFILSGFILAYTYATTEGTTRGGARVFWVARIARIYPVYLLGLVLALGPYLATEHNIQNITISIGSHLVMLHAWLPGTLDLNQPSWSLSVEAFNLSVRISVYLWLISQFSIHTTGAGDCNGPALRAAVADSGKNDVTSPLSVSINSNLSGASPTTINLADDLISIFAAGVNVRLMDADRSCCQLVGLSENRSVVVLVGCWMKKGTQLFAAKPMKRPSDGPETGLSFSKRSVVFAMKIGCA